MCKFDNVKSELDDQELDASNESQVLKLLLVVI